MNSEIRNPKSEIRGKVISRIVDANVNRAAEGLRVMEEIARFIVEHKGLTAELKALRARLRRLAIKAGDIEQRRVATDVGRKSFTGSEGRRQSVRDVLAANAKRVQEALRVLEEFSKLDAPALGRSFKLVRFRSYRLEQELVHRLVR